MCSSHTAPLAAGMLGGSCEGGAKSLAYVDKVARRPAATGQKRTVGTVMANGLLREELMCSTSSKFYNRTRRHSHLEGGPEVFESASL